MLNKEKLSHGFNKQSSSTMLLLLYDTKFQVHTWLIVSEDHHQKLL